VAAPEDELLDDELLEEELLDDELLEDELLDDELLELELLELEDDDELDDPLLLGAPPQAAIASANAAINKSREGRGHCAV
jgi:hypothetical protein